MDELGLHPASWPRKPGEKLPRGVAPLTPAIKVSAERRKAESVVISNMLENTIRVKK